MFDFLEANLVKRGVAEHPIGGSMQITKPSHFWFLDEKGLNDESMKSFTAVTTRGNQNPTTQHGHTLSHISVLNIISASGEVARPAVVVARKQYHPEWEALWPEAVLDNSEKGSFTAVSFVQLLADTFIDHVRSSHPRDGWAV